MTLYDKQFHSMRDEKTRHAAHVILNVLFENMPVPKSAVDVGCGVGTWLSVLHELGANTILGIDGPWIDASQLVIPENSFQSKDLCQVDMLSLERRFELAICLEVAEHITSDKAFKFAKFLTDASDIILFSAAIPHQGGTGHVNEQWPLYWEKIFSSIGYSVIDSIRPRIWDDDNIPWWYRQNILIFIKDDVCKSGVINKFNAQKNLDFAAKSIVHPDLLIFKENLICENKYVYTEEAFKLLAKAIINAIKRRFAK